MKKEFLKVSYSRMNVADIEAAVSMINHHAANGLMLEKNFTDLLSTLTNYLVAKIDQEPVGTCGIKIWLTRDI